MKKSNRCLAVILALVLLIPGSGVSSTVYAGEGPEIGQESLEAVEASNAIEDGASSESGEEAPEKTEEENQEDKKQDSQPESSDEPNLKEEETDEKKSDEEKSIDNSNQPMLLEAGGLLSMGMANGGAFDPGGAAQEVTVTFKPRKEGSSRRLEITGFDSAGLTVSTRPIVSHPITSTTFSGSALIVNFADDFTAGGDISFRFSIKQSNEKNFAKGVMEENGKFYGKGLTLTEYVGGTADQSTTSKVPVEYTMTNADLFSEKSPYYNDTAQLTFSSGMVLYTNPDSVESPNGGGWQKKEAEYFLRTLPADKWWKNRDYISPRYIRNLHLEIPLPPNVFYVSSDYEGGKSGITISASSDKTYVYFDCAEYNPNSELKFTMTLDYTKVSSSGGADQYGINRWHDFWSNTSTITSRNQAGKPWKFTGDIYGITQSKTFYDRSSLVLGTMIAMNRVYDLLGNYNYSKKITNKNLTLRISEENGTDRQNDCRTLTPQMDLFTDLNYTRRTTTEFEPQIRVKEVRNSGNVKGTGTITVTFYTNLGNTVAKPMAASVQAPAMQEGEYVNKITVDATGNRIGSYYFIVDYMDVDLNGNQLAVGTVSKVKTSYEIVGYGPKNPLKDNTTTATITYVESKIAEPIIKRNIDRKDYTYAYYATGYSYKNINLLSVSNTGAEVGDIVNRELTKIRVLPNAWLVSDAADDKEAFFPYQMLSSSPATLTLTGYTTSNLPDIKIPYTTSAGNSGEVIVPASAFSFSGSSASAKVNIHLPEGEVVNALGCEISNLPSWAAVSLTLDNLEIPDDILPSGRKIETLHTDLSQEGESTRWNTESSNKAYFTIPSGAEKEISFRDAAYMRAFWKIGVGFGESQYRTSDNESTVRPPILQGEKTTLKFRLTDTAYNPTYGFEIDKNFNYIAGSFAGTDKKIKFIEEWLPNYFNDSSDTEHYGNGLLRIRFIGSGDEAYNMFPIKNGNYDGYPPYDYFKMTLQAKSQTNPGIYKMIPMLYRSDKWAKENLVGKQMEIRGWTGTGFGLMPEIKKQTSVYITNYSKTSNTADRYDIDGDGDVSALIDVRPPGGVFDGDPAYMQQVTKQSTTNIQTYLIDPKTGVEIRDAELYPHQSVEFVQAMELLSAGNGTDFIGYYHIPKRNHKIDYADADGNHQTHVSEFNTYLTGFLSTTVDGVQVPPDAGLKVYYYISPDPDNPDSDDHNAMKELVDGQTDTSPNYKTQAQIEQMAMDQGVEVKDILKDCTMIKIKADVIETGKAIITKAALAIGHKEEGDKESIYDYFSGQYRYSLDTGTRLPASYTPLTTLSMLPYKVEGIVFYDKDANSLASPLESGAAGIDVELWQTGTDPHTGTAIPDTLVDTQLSGADGSYSFKVAYHGDYFLKFKLTDGKKLSLKNKYGGFAYEQSVFDPVKEGGLDYAKANFSLSDHSLPYQNAGLVDIRTLTVPEDIYLSEGETADLTYDIAPDYLMNELDYKIVPTLQSDAANDPYFTVGTDTPSITGKAVGEGTITVSIPAAPLDGTTYITKTVTVHVEPASVASVSVPAKAEIYAVQGKSNEVIAPELTIYNYNQDPVKAYIKRIDTNNTGRGKSLKLVKQKSSYDTDEISLKVKPIDRTNPFSALANTDLTQVEYIKGGLLLGTMEPFDGNSNWGKFTFGGEYNPAIVSTNLEDNRFVMSYRFEKAGTP